MLIVSHVEAVFRCGIARRMRQSFGAVIKVAGVLLQASAPKCAICWTTYTGLISASWFAVRNGDPHLLIVAAFAVLMSLAAALRRALKMRRYIGLSCVMLAWALLLAGWLIDLQPIRYAGLLMLLISYLPEKARTGPRRRADDMFPERHETDIGQ